MKRLIFVAMLIAVLLVAAQCGGAAAPEPAAPAQQESAAAEEESAPAAEEAMPSEEVQTVVIGYTASNTGSQEVPSRGQTRGLELWLEDVNEEGVTLSDGTLVKF